MSLANRQPEMEFGGSMIHPGTTCGELLVLVEPLSMWGGLDLDSGRICDANHPQYGEMLAGRIIMMESGRGSSSAASSLVEAIRLGTAPAGILLLRADPILSIGALVAADLYQKIMPIVVVDPDDWDAIAAGASVNIVADRNQCLIRLSKMSD